MCISQRKLFLASLTVANRCLIAYRSLSSTPKGITRHTPHNWSYEIYASFEHIIRGSIECLSIGQDQCIPFLFYAHASIVRFNQSIPTSTAAHHASECSHKDAEHIIRGSIISLSIGQHQSFLLLFFLPSHPSFNSSSRVHSSPSLLPHQPHSYTAYKQRHKRVFMHIPIIIMIMQ